APERYDEAAEAFKAASGHIRSTMARGLSWRVAPELRFMLDKSVDEAERITRALERDALRNQ
ncbi:MAG: ribosome-binding factor A, partial [Eggerthellaceae bacterium]|nr:ribosome-binding factor A [Eggerthellaceae bacterium]